MSDYIKRDLGRIIANASESDIDAPTWDEQKKRLKAVQSADVAPVVRCKDCKWNGNDHHFCYRWYKGDDDFCSKGERKDNEID